MQVFWFILKYDVEQGIRNFIYLTTDWAQDITSINPHFGTKDDLRALVQAAHDKDILVMVDVVA